jgi:hypothetical protein
MSASREEAPLGRYLIYLGLVAFFGVGVLSYNLLCLLTQWFPTSERRKRWSRRIMIALLKTFIAAIQAGGVGRVRFRHW